MNVSPFLNWLLRTSWQASILVVLVLAVQWLARRRLNARWQYALWLLVVVRLAMPSLPASSWSVFNAVHYAAATGTLPRAASDVAPPTVSFPVSAPITETQSLPENVQHSRIESPPAVAPAVYDKQRFMRNAAIVWTVGSQGIEIGRKGCKSRPSRI